MLVMDKLYEVTDLNFADMRIEGAETDLQLSDVPVEEVFSITDFKDFDIKLRNWHGMVVTFSDYVKKRKIKF